jgi:hypothetical protein
MGREIELAFPLATLAEGQRVPPAAVEGMDAMAEGVDDVEQPGTGAPGEAAAAYRRFLELAPGQPGTGLNMEKARQRLAELERGTGLGFPPAAGP